MKKRQPLVEEIKVAIPAVRCFDALAGRPSSFFLDSGMDPARLGRYSFMGSDPFLVLRSRGERITLVREGEGEVRWGNPFDILGELLEENGMYHRLWTIQNALKKDFDEETQKTDFVNSP